jgi:hypothetical protein
LLPKRIYICLFFCEFKYITQAGREMSLSLAARITSGSEPIEVIVLFEVLPIFARVSVLTTILNKYNIKYQKGKKNNVAGLAG